MGGHMGKHQGGKNAAAAAFFYLHRSIYRSFRNPLSARVTGLGLTDRQSEYPNPMPLTFPFTFS